MKHTKQTKDEIRQYSVVDYEGNVYGHDMTLFSAECLINNFSKKEIVDKEIEII